MMRKYLLSLFLLLSITAAQADYNNGNLPAGSTVGGQPIASTPLSLSDLAAGTNNTIIGYNGSGTGSIVSIGSGCTLSGGTLTCAGTGGAFSGLTGGTNSTAAMVVGTGASLGVTGSGTIAATSVPASGLIGSTLASGITGSSLTSVGILGNLTVTNPISGSVTGNAVTVTNGIYSTDTGTVTNAMLAGSIANAKLVNSSITVAGHSISLGGTQTIACGDLSNGAASCSTDATNATNISSGTLAAARVATLNQNTTGSAGSLSISGQTGLLSYTGITSTSRIKTVRDAADTLLELGGSYTPTGTWIWTSASVTWPTFNQNTSGTATNATNTAITEDTTTNSTMFPTWVTANTGNLPQKTTSTKLTFNPSTGALSSTSFSGAGTGLTGTAASLTAGTVSTISGLITNGTGVTISGSGTSGSPYSIAATGGGSSAFSSITSGTNTSAAMLVGTGASLVPTGSGTITATTAAALSTGRTISITGDLGYTSPSFDGSGNITAAGTLASVNSNTGSFGSSTSIPSFTVNAKGLITAASSNAVIAPAGTLTGTALPSGVVISSLTTVGALSSGSVTTGFTPIGLAQGGTPGFLTPLWTQALLNVINGTGNALFCADGDSTTFGAFSIASSSNLVGFSLPTQISQDLNTVYGINSNSNGWAGDGIGNGGFGTYDSRIVVGSSWTDDTTIISLGGYTFKATTGTNSIDITYPIPYDTVHPMHIQKTGGGVISYQLDSATPVTVSTSGTTGLVVDTVTGTLATHVLHIKWSSGGQINFDGIRDAYDSTHPSVNVLNMGVSGAKASDLSSATAAYSPGNSAAWTALGCNLTEDQIGINDWVGATSTTTFNTEMQSLITAQHVSGDTLIASPVASISADGTAPVLATQQTYVDKLRSLASSNSLNFLNIFQRWAYNQTNAEINGQNLYANSDSTGLHPNGGGYGEEALAFVHAIVNMSMVPQATLGGTTSLYSGNINIVSTDTDGASFTLDATGGGGSAFFFSSSGALFSTPNQFNIINKTLGSGPLAIFGASSPTAGAVIDVQSTAVLGFDSNNNYAGDGCDTCISRDSSGVFDFGTGAQGSKAGTVNAATINQNSIQVFSTAGTGISKSGATVNSNAVYQMSFQPGLMTSVSNAKSAFAKVSKASTVDNIEASAQQFSCTGNPTVTMYECGTSTTCASSPVTIGSATLTAAGTVVNGTVSNAAITAGDYIAFAISAGTCITLDISVTAQVHSN